ncbi:AAA family ATPase [Paludibaculum fermentans]|uniref:AAA family ATPase n=1 Tax=Paludibaculum fermentans TaxID=1473598 RepID=UPI003EB7A213
MLRRLYIDNFQAFVNFELRFDRKQLILGRNGSGKSSMLVALLKLRQFVARGDRAEDTFFPQERTRWMDHPRQTWELELELESETYLYRLVIEHVDGQTKPVVIEESIHCGGKPVFGFSAGVVQLYSDRFELDVSYPFDPHRSALATIQPRADKRVLSRFLNWLPKLLFFRLNPFNMGLRAEGEDLAPNVDLSNFSAWYRHLVQTFPRENVEFLNSLQSSIDDFGYLQLESAGENLRILTAEFHSQNGRDVKYGFQQLSEGQRCLISLYAILHFVLIRECTVFIDEPDNFISLREIQPWLMAADDLIEEGRGQLFLISHHPELINQWAPHSGIRFFREKGGPVRSKPFIGDRSSLLTPSEMISRGWEGE